MLRPSQRFTKIRFQCPMCKHEEETVLDQGGHRKCRMCGNEAMLRLHFEGGYNRSRDARGDKPAQT
jgi:hypothetical protein